MEKLWFASYPSGVTHEQVAMMGLSSAEDLHHTHLDQAASPDVHGRSRFAKLSIHDGSKVKIAPVHSDFWCDC